MSISRLLQSKISVLILVAAVSGTVYFNSIDNGFHFDDVHHIVNNTYIRDLGNIPLFFVDIDTFSAFEAGHYRPLLLASHAINYSLGRLNPAGYHAFNIALHAGAAFLVFLIVHALSRVFFIAISAALIFAVHPFNSEAINYISARSSVMSGFFYLLAFYCWIRFRNVAADVAAGLSLRPRTVQVSQAKACGYSLRDQGDVPRNPETSSGQSLKVAATSYYIASLLAFFLGMLTKEILITLPIILWLYDLYFVPSEDRSFKRYTRFLPLYIRYTALVVVPYLFLVLVFAGVSVSTGEPPRPYYLHLLIETKILVRYLYLLFFPVKLSVEHAVYGVTSIFDWWVLGSITLLLSVIGSSFYLYRRRDHEWQIVSFFILWFFITMLLTTLVRLNAPLQENRGYLASAGFAAFLGIVINRFAQQSIYRTALKTSAIILILGLYALGTMDRNTIWKDDLTLWLDAVKKYPLAWRAHYHLGKNYEKLNLEGRALKEYRMVLEIKPDFHHARREIGNIFLRNGKTDLAILEFKRASSIKPTDFQNRMDLARAYMKAGQMNLAKNECEKVVELDNASKRGRPTVKKEDPFVEEAEACLRWFRAEGRHRDTPSL